MYNSYRTQRRSGKILLCYYEFSDMLIYLLFINIH